MKPKIAMSVKIYHNPRCSKSRQTLELIRARGIEPDIVDYLKTPPETAELKRIIARLGVEVRDIMRSGEAVYKELDLARPELSEDELIAAIHAHPRLLQRPIVVRGEQARIGRPPESVEDILP